MRWSTPLLLLVVLSSCFLTRDLKQERFTYNTNGQLLTLPLQVPHGFDRVKRETDPAGNTAQIYTYSNGMTFYAAHLADTAKQYQYIDYTRNIPLPHPKGGWIYKGMDSTERYWREIRMANYKFGYTGVPRSLEWTFDQALNWVSMQPLP